MLLLEFCGDFNNSGFLGHSIKFENHEAVNTTKQNCFVGLKLSINYFVMSVIADSKHKRQ